jgi:hypothetical protein
MRDAALFEAFRSGTIAKRAWHHQAHVRVAYLHLRRYPFSVAVERMGAGIRKLNLVLGVRDGLAMGYHETLTRAFMCAIWATLRSAGPEKDSKAFWNANPHLWARTLPRLYYTRKRMMTPAAKMRFVLPDVAPLPGPRGWPGAARRPRTVSRRGRAAAGR